MKRIALIAYRFFVFLLAALAVVSLVIYFTFAASLPTIDGDHSVRGLSETVSIDRDARGVPHIVAANRRDLAFATGFVHGQDRFFQMDLMRRKAAGELSEIVGAATLPADKAVRIHRFRYRAEQVLSRMRAQRASSSEFDILSAYAEGVNAAMAAVSRKPFEYYLLRADPEPWTPTDSLLVVFAMYLELNDERASRDIRRYRAASVFPDSVYRFLYPSGGEWDAPVAGEPADTVALPSVRDFSLRATRVVDDSAPEVIASKRRSLLIANDADLLPGSNSWAVAGRLTGTGAALVANDMHLGLAVPGTFYQARLRHTGKRAVDLTGVTLPGTPALVAGSNGHVVWSNTNSNGDWVDAVRIEWADGRQAYQTAEGPRAVTLQPEVIQVKDGSPVTVMVRETIWGPIIELPATSASNGGEINERSAFAIRWIAHFPRAVTLGHLQLETVKDAESATRIANTIGMPPQNFVVGDQAGNIAWTIAGPVPKRQIANNRAQNFRDDNDWHGWLAPDEYPRIVNPPSGRIWTANARVVEGSALELLGDGGYALGARAGQIRDALESQDALTIEDMRAIQLDDAALFLARWQASLIDVLSPLVTDANADRQAYRDLVEAWLPNAVPESVGYRLVRAYRFAVRRRVVEMLTVALTDRFGSEPAPYMGRQFEQPLWALVSEKPMHFLSADYSDWDDLLVQSVDDVIAFLNENYPGPLADRQWGEVNTAAILHPLSPAVPSLSRFLDMPATPLAGDSNMPRVQAPAFGASERFAVSPGHEEAAYLQLPAGQSGHPLSDFYRAGHEAWVNGEPSPFLPGAAQHSLLLRPSN